MSVISNSYMKSLLKTVYLSGVTNNKYQNSPVLSAIKKESWGGGKEIKYAAQYGNGGNFGSVYSTIVNNPTTGARNLEWTAEQGYTFGLFDINQPEILTSAEDRGAYMKILSNKMAACFDGMSKTLATYLYGGKYGVIDQLQEDKSIIAGSNTIDVTSAGAIKLDVGSRFQIASAGAANTALPSSALLDAVMTVTAIDENTITFTSTAAVTAYAGDYIELYTSRVGNDARGIEGLADIIPSYFGRDTSDANWNSYIGTDFRGVDRSVSTARLAGQYVAAANSGNTRLTDALVSLLKKTKRAGGLNNMIIINDETWDAVGEELGIQKNLWQATNGGVTKQGATAGVSDLAVAFGQAFVDRVVIDPYCTEGKAYSLEKDDLTFYDLGNVSRVLDPVANDQMGKHDIESVGDQGFGNSFGSNVNIDKLFTVTEGAAGEYGPAFNIAAHVFGNFILRKTASAGVADLA